MNKNTILSLFMCLCMGFSLQAQETISISGSVLLAEVPIPIPDYPVSMSLEYGANVGSYFETITDENGAYEFVFELEANPAGEFAVAIVSLFDFCTGEIGEQAFDVGPGFTEFENVDFVVCSELNPPGPNENCAAFFSAEPLEGEPNGFQFVDLSYSDIPVSSWFWDFGDGTTSTEQNPEHIYENEGGYDVILTITTDSCTSTVVSPVFAPNDGCECPDFFSPVCVFNGTDTLNYDNYCEAVCDGFEDNQIFECDIIVNPCGCDDEYNPVCVYTPSGIVLYFYNPCQAECEGYEPQLYGPCDNIQDGCHALFFVDQQDFNSLTVTFNDLSTSTEGTITEWLWDFGDGNTSTEQSPTYTYAEGGIYDITLIIVTDSGCTATYSEHICIGVINECNCPAVYDPVCISTFGIIITFPNACEAECAGMNLDDQVECEIEPGCECPDVFEPVCVTTASGEVQIFPNACFAECAGFGADAQNNCEDFEDCICPEIYDPVCVTGPNGIVLTFSNACFAECEGYTEADFLDECPGDTGCECPDVYDPVCFITDNGDVITFENMCVAISCEGYSPNAMVDCNGNDPCVCPDIFAPVCIETASGDTLSFVNACYAECAGFEADAFVDCNNIDSPCDCPFIYDPVCVQTVAGQIEFFNACTAECEGFDPANFVDCESDPFGDCFANFFTDAIDDTGLLIQFTDASFSNTQEITVWEWQFGDGATSTEQNPVHQYSSTGFYDISLTITTADGCVSTSSQHIYLGDGGTVGGPECQSIFFFTQNEENQTTFDFEDLSLGDVVSWDWDFGDGNGSTEQNPSHTYAEDGIYLVTLTIATASCESTMTMLLISNPDIIYESDCVALFIPFILPEELTVVFFPLVLGEVVSYEWDFGDGTTSTEPLAFYQYAEPGVYEVSLTVVTADGCTNTFNITIDLIGNNFTGSPSFLNVTSTEEVIDPSSIRLFPNPVQERLRLDFNSNLEEEVQISLIGIDGRNYQNQQQLLNKGEQRVELQVQDLAPGIYFVRLQTANSVQSIKFVKE